MEEPVLVEYVTVWQSHAGQCWAGGNGTAGTTMAVPVFKGEKWRRLELAL